jgi:hypothetical protein
MLEIWIKLLISIVTFSSLILLTFAIFKIPLLEHHRIIAIMSLVLGTVSFYARFIVETPFFALINFSFFVVLLMVLKRYPILYSFIVCGIGLLVVGVIDSIVSIASIQLEFADMYLLSNSIKHFALVNLAATCVALLITFVLKYFNFGFSFIIKKFHSSQVFKSHNYLWAVIIVISITVVQIGYFIINVLSLHVYIFLGIASGLLFTLLMAYKQNRKALRDRFGR